MSELNTIRGVACLEAAKAICKRRAAEATKSGDKAMADKYRAKVESYATALCRARALIAGHVAGVN